MNYVKFLFCVILQMSFFSCVVDRPGEGKSAVRGYFMAQSLIDALDKFNKDSSYYPIDLYSLIPKYLNDFPVNSSKFYLIYDRPDSIQDYVLQFKYYGPGTNICNYTPTNKWKCYGFY